MLAPIVVLACKLENAMLWPGSLQHIQCPLGWCLVGQVVHQGAGHLKELVDAGTMLGALVLFKCFKLAWSAARDVCSSV
jgi:hypothetical protein